MNLNKLQLPLQTLSLVLGFMVWVILSSLMPFIKEDLHLPADRIAWITAIPVVLGSILRVPIGYWTNRFGARRLFFISFLLLLVPVYYVSIAKSFTDLFIGGIFLGIGGAVFSVGVTSLPKYYPKEKHGFINGIYGIGNLGTAISTFFAPILATHYGWTFTVKCYLGILILFALFNFFLGDRNEPKVLTPISEQIKGVYKNEKLWALSLFYFITFGSFVAFTVYLPNFLVANFHLAKVDAGFRTAGFILIATALRPVGGWMGDRFNPFKILMFVFAGFTFAAVILSFSPSLAMYTIGCLSISVCAGLGNGTIFKLVPLYFSKQAGIVNGIVSAMGGLGGFFPPLILSMLYNATGHYSIGFMALSEIALASFILVFWMFYQEKLKLSATILEHTTEAMIVTDINGAITSINPSFTAITGYTIEDVLGKNPNILQSGQQGKEFYEKMWAELKQEGSWQGEIWNKRKNGESYLEWLTISAIKNEGGEVKYYAGMFSDITTYRNKLKPQVNQMYV